MSKAIDNSCGCSDVSFSAEERVQISILVDSETICDLLKEIADNDINIDGYFIQEIACDTNIFTFALGNSKEQRSSDLRTVECILNKWCIDFVKSDTLRVSFSSNKPVSLAKIYCALSECLDISTSYNAKCKGIYIETCDNCKAEKIINSLN